VCADCVVNACTSIDIVLYKLLQIIIHFSLSCCSIYSATFYFRLGIDVMKLAVKASKMWNYALAVVFISDFMYFKISFPIPLPIMIPAWLLIRFCDFGFDSFCVI
jgi:hypothetical protein